jgi:undecaprenyl-diphosphatase
MRLMEDILRAIVLGIVQGLSEFLPISSSGHLIVVRDLFDWQFTDNLTFDVALHVGTTVAVLAYFWREWVSMFRSAVRWLAGDREHRVGETYTHRTFALIALGSLPIALIGAAFESEIEKELRDPVVVGALLIAFSAVLLGADRFGRGHRSLHEASWLDAVFIGGAQALALAPGVSRSGITISAGLFRHFNRQDAARYSFLLSTPAIGGAALLKFTEAFRDGTLDDSVDQLVFGALAAAIVGWLAIAYLMRLVRTSSFLPFVVYRLIAGSFIVAYFAF